jgi:hypothetical protein
MGKPDALSCCVDHGSGREDNSNMTMLSPELFWVHILSGLDIVGEEHDILWDVRHSLHNNDLEESVTKAAWELHRDCGHGTVSSAEWSELDSLLMFHGKIYIPQDQDLHHHIMEQHHNSCVAGHAWHWKTLELVTHNYWWPQMFHYIGLYIKTCNLCMWTKLQHHKPHSELHSMEPPEEQWDMITVYFMIELPNVHGYNAIINIVNSIGKRTHFMPMHTTVNAEGATRLYLKEVWKLHGLPHSVWSDCGLHV